MSELRGVYAEKALSQIPRLLSLQDRNPYSPTYGCFKRTYWLDKTVDFPDALPQYGVLSLALAYTAPFDPSVGSGQAAQGDMRNIYYHQPKVREWILAGMKYWTKIQHSDGSFDEFYPNERGWTGPTGFLLYAMLKSYMLLVERGEFPEECGEEFFGACRKAADYIIKWDEHGVLANHHAMAVLPTYYAYHVLKDEALREGYEKKLEEFLKHHSSEGWSLEYDGADIGYLSATVSFLGKVWKLNKDERLLKVMRESVEFLSYFVYPNGFFAGSMGSRNTLHFYPHGCELLAPEFPLAGRIADAMLESLRDGKIVPAEIMADRYFLYRIPEHLESYVDFGKRAEGGHLPHERPDFRSVFPKGRFYVQKHGSAYLVANAAKGGVVKFFNVRAGALRLNDCGIIGQTTSGEVLTSQWIDPAFTFEPHDNGFVVSGRFHRVPANKLFTPWKFIVFRVVLLLLGWNAAMACRIKGWIRKMLMLKSGALPVQFKRSVELVNDSLRITDTIELGGGVQFESLQLGDEFFVRYVPQSRYFQSQEFDADVYKLSNGELRALNESGRLEVVRKVGITSPQ